MKQMRKYLKAVRREFYPMFITRATVNTFTNVLRYPCGLTKIFPLEKIPIFQSTNYIDFSFNLQIILKNTLIKCEFYTNCLNSCPKLTCIMSELARLELFRSGKSCPLLSVVIPHTLHMQWMEIRLKHDRVLL